MQLPHASVCLSLRLSVSGCWRVLPSGSRRSRRTAPAPLSCPAPHPLGERIRHRRRDSRQPRRAELVTDCTASCLAHCLTDCTLRDPLAAHAARSINQSVVPPQLGPSTLPTRVRPPRSPMSRLLHLLAHHGDAAPPLHARLPSPRRPSAHAHSYAAPPSDSQPTTPAVATPRRRHRPRPGLQVAQQAAL